MSIIKGKIMRLYHLDSVNTKTNERTRLTRYPMSHDEVFTMKSKFTEHYFRRLELVEVVFIGDEQDLIELIKCGA